MLGIACSKIETKGFIITKKISALEMDAKYGNPEDVWWKREMEEAEEDWSHFYIIQGPKNNGSNETMRNPANSSGSVVHFGEFLECDWLLVTGFRKNIRDENEVKNILKYVLNRCAATLIDDEWEKIKLERDSEHYGVAVKIEPIARSVRYKSITCPEHLVSKGENQIYQATFTDTKSWDLVNQQTIPRSFAVVRGFEGSPQEVAARLHVLNTHLHRHIAKSLIVLYGNVSQMIKMQDEGNSLVHDTESIAFIYGVLSEKEEEKLKGFMRRTSSKPGYARCGTFMYEFYSSVGQIIHFQFCSINVLKQMAVFEFKRIEDESHPKEVYGKLVKLFPKIAWIYVEIQGGERVYVALFSDGGPMGSKRDLTLLKKREDSEMPTLSFAGRTTGTVKLIERRRWRIEQAQKGYLKVSPWIQIFKEEQEGVTTEKAGRTIRKWSDSADATAGSSAFNMGTSSNGSTETDRSAWDSGESASSNPGRGAFVPSFNPSNKLDPGKGQPFRPAMAASLKPTKKEDASLGSSEKERAEGSTPSALTFSTANTRLQAELSAANERIKRVEAEKEELKKSFEAAQARDRLKHDQERKESNARIATLEQTVAQMQQYFQALMGAQSNSFPSPGPLGNTELKEDVSEADIAVSTKRRMRSTTVAVVADLSLTPAVALPLPVPELSTVPAFSVDLRRELPLSKKQQKKRGLPKKLSDMAVVPETSPTPFQQLPNRFSSLQMEDGEVPEPVTSAIELDSHSAATQASLECSASSSIFGELKEQALDAMELDEVLPINHAEVTISEIFGSMEQPFTSTRTGIPYHFNGIELEGVDILEYMTQGEMEPLITERSRNPYQILVKPSSDLGLDGAGSYTIPLGMGAYATEPIPVGSSIVFESKSITSIEFAELQRKRATSYVMQSGQVLHDAAEARKKGDIASAINNSVNVWSRYWNRPARNHCTLTYSPQTDSFSYKVTRAIQSGEEIYAAYASSYHMKRHIEDSRTSIPTHIKQPFSKLTQDRFVAAAKKVEVGLNGLTVALTFDPEAEEVIEELMLATYCHDEMRAQKFLQEHASYKLTMMKPIKDPSAKFIVRNGQCGVDSIFFLHCKQRGLNWPKEWEARKQALATYLKQVNDLLEINPVFLKLGQSEQLRARELLDKNINAVQSASGLPEVDFLPNWMAMLFAVDVRLTLWEPRDDATLTMTMHNLQGSPYVKYEQLSELSKCQHALKLAHSHFEPITSPSLDLFPSVVDSLIQALFARYVAKTSVEI